MDTREKFVDETGNTNPQHWQVEITGQHVAVKCQFLRPFSAHRKPRGKIKTFSARSRKRMLEWISKVNWKGITNGTFVTLTFPDEICFMGKDNRGLCLYKFFRSMENYLGREIGALWRCEWIDRKSGLHVGMFAPHYHIIIPEARFISKKKIVQWWTSACQWDEPINVDKRRLNDADHHKLYVAKYAAKMPDFSLLGYVSYSNIDGRHWGYHRPSLIPKFPTVVYDGLSERQIEMLKYLGRVHFDWYGEFAELGYTMFGKLGTEMVEAIRKLCLDGELA
jgi:hypothetical protein